MPRQLALLSFLLLVGCSGATQAARPAPLQHRFCVYVPHREASAARAEGDGGQATALAPGRRAVGSPAVPLNGSTTLPPRAGVNSTPTQDTKG